MIKVLHELFFSDATLCRRLAVGLAFMLVPLVLVIAGTFFSQNLIIDNLTEIAEEATEEIGPVLRIHKALHEMMMPVHDYLIHGNREQERKRYDQRALEVDRAFDEALGGPFALVEEAKKVREAFESWQNVRATGRWILDTTGGPGDSDGTAAMEIFDHQVEETLGPIENFYRHAQKEITEAEKDVSAIKNRTRYFVALMLVIGLGMALISALVLSRSILVPMQALKKGVNRLEAGDLLHRVDLPSRDEFGMLASAFNRMAQELEKNHRSLEELAYRDELTGLNNRRRFLACLETEINRSVRYGTPLGLLILDIDHFKLINDTYGHAAGDEALRQIAAALRDTLRGCDTVARIGGEEFAVILPQAGIGPSLDTAERIRESVEKITVLHGPHSFQLTTSVGAATFPDMAGSPDDLYRAADKGLYKAKAGGRNQVGRFQAFGNETGYSMLPLTPTTPS